jgi:hypothetical protein
MSFYLARVLFSGSLVFQTQIHLALPPFVRTGLESFPPPGRSKGFASRRPWMCGVSHLAGNEGYHPFHVQGIPYRDQKPSQPPFLGVSVIV